MPFSDIRYTPDIKLHRGLVVRIVEKMIRVGQCDKWSFDEILSVGLSEAWTVLNRYYDPKRGTVSTLLYRVLAGRIRRVYQIEFGVKRDWVYRERSLEQMVTVDGEEVDDLISNQQTPLEQLISSETRINNCRQIRDLHDKAWAKMSSEQAGMVCGVLRGRTQTEVGREYGVHRRRVYANKRDFMEMIKRIQTSKKV